MAFDLDKLVSEQTSVKRKKRFEFTFEGKTYTMPNEIDMIGLRAATKGDVATAFKRALGPMQYAEIEASDSVLQQASILELMGAYYDHVGGLTAGESSASSSSSQSTAGPSKWTSRASTPARSSRR